MHLVLAAIQNSDIWPADHPVGLKGILISFIVALVVLAFIVALLYVIDKYVHTLPDGFKLIVAIILSAAVVIWGITLFI